MRPDLDELFGAMYDANVYDPIEIYGQTCKVSNILSELSEESKFQTSLKPQFSAEAKSRFNSATIAG